MMKGHSDEVENEGQFTSIMQSFGQSFLQPDISIFRQNLETLESLNSKWKLYHKVSQYIVPVAFERSCVVRT